MIRSPDQSAADLIISAIFQLYRPQLQLYRRFSKFIDHNSNYIGLPTKTDNDRSSLLKNNKKPRFHHMRNQGLSYYH
ncbi:Uncharacterized protein BW664_01088 [Bacillus mycoides]|nr:Uncharacterized protein BW664_01088 [Bacillus mycoides]